MRRLLAAFAIVIAAASPASAATAESGALVPPFGGSLFCNVVNTSDVERTVTLEILNSVAEVVTQELLVGPNGTNSFSAVNGVRCRITFKGPRKTLRFTAQAADAGGVPLMAISFD